MHNNKHSNHIFRATATLLLLLLCVCSAVAREKNRAIALPFEDSVYNFRMLYEYDSWNRVQRIVYPDSEVVTYNYDLGGNLCRVHNFKANHRDTLIKNILYDEFGHRTQVVFGNGVTTNYTYDILQRLNLLETKKPSSPALQKISYSFDLEDNITKVENTAGGANGLGGAYVNTYNYDDLYRLTAANGSYSGNNTNYSLEMSYTPAGRLCGKLQGYTGTANTYAYSPSAKPHAVRRYYNGLTNELSNLRWDNNGNLAQQTVYSVNNNTTNYQTMRMLFWDEDDRLNLVASDGYLSYYAYGHDGNRAIKMTGNAAIDPTGTLLNSTNLENITIYPNEYLTVTQAEYTKYYYAGGNRIASKIGTGGFGKMTRLCTQDLNLTANANSLFGNALQLVTSATNQPADEYPVDVCNGYSVATELLTDPLSNIYISNTSLNFTQNNLLQQFRQNLTGGTEAVYYFHSDHLGSASWITSGTGGAVQHLLYLPFGEHFVNERSAAYDERFTFTGKERDMETGYYYHGARFNSSDIGWLSVDPMSDKYPSLTPYNYCAWNPIKLVDPDGEEIDDDIVIKGKNNSSVTIKTDLIDISVDVSSLDIDFEGEYELQGEDLLSAALDIVGIVDPTGVADALNAGLQAKNGDWLGAGLSLAGVIPYVGDLAKVGKIGKDVKIIKDAVNTLNTVHGNSKYSMKAQHLYEIYEKKTGDVVKTGISGGKVSKNGKSYRATSQVNKINKLEDADNYDSRIIETFPAGQGARQKALDAEKNNANKHRGTLDKRYHQRP